MVVLKVKIVYKIKVCPYFIDVLDPSLYKPLALIRLIRYQPTNNIQDFIQFRPSHNKNIESIASPSKISSTTNSQKRLKKTMDENTEKASIKRERILASTIKSPSKTVIKQKLSVQSASINISKNRPQTSVSINNP